MPIIENYIIKDEPIALYNKTKSHCKGVLPKFIIGFIIIYMIMNWVPEFLGMLYTTSYVDVIAQFREIDESLREQLPSTPAVVYLYAFLFTGVFTLGRALYSLTFIRNKNTEYKAMFEGFVFYFKAFGLYLIKTLIVSMWSMLFVFPGILAALNFSQAFYILADNPEKGIFQCLAESKFRMLGNRMTYFKVFLLYVPYIMLGYLPAAIMTWTNLVDTTTITGIAVLMIAEIPLYCAFGYFEAGKAAFYELLISQGFENFRYAGQDAFREIAVTDVL